MKESRWLSRNAKSLAEKLVVITGATGGIGQEICRYVLQLSGRLLMVNRSREKSEALKARLLREFPRGEIRYLTAELDDMTSVRAVCEKLKGESPDYLLLNAGAYSIPRKICDTGFDNVFQINFISHYYMTKQLLPILEQRGGKVIAMGSIAHTYSHTDPEDVDFSGRKPSSLVYGNSKRYLMFALSELMRESKADFAIAHPGITFTNITAHYPKLIFAVIKWPMKVIFMRPHTAARSMVKALFENVPYLYWIGPGIFDIWGNPGVKKLKTCPAAERSRIFSTAEKIYGDVCEDSAFL